MRLLFVHDHRFVRGQNGAVYTPGSFPAAVWQRYLRHFDELLVLGRDGGELAIGTDLAVSSRPSVAFEFAPNLASLRQLIRPTREARGKMVAAIESADAVVARLPSELGLMAVKMARRLKKPYSVEVVACAWEVLLYYGSPKYRLYAPLFFHRTRRAILKAPLALYVTSKWLQSRYPTRGFSTFASNVETVPISGDAALRRRERLQEIALGRPPRLGTIASLHSKYKGVQTAIGAIARLREEGLDLSFSVLGPGDSGPYELLASKAGVQDLVCFDGTRSAGEGVRKWLDELDIYLQPSFCEGLPRATVEAMSRGAACIGSTSGGIPELLSPAWTHRPGDDVALADRIRALATDPQELVRVSDAAIVQARDFAPDVLMKRRDAIYGRLRAAAQRADDG